MISSVDVKLTKHAIERYRERVRDGATVEEIKRHVYLSRCVGRKQEKRINRRFPWRRGQENITYYFTKLRRKDERKVIFVLHWTDAGKCVLITCWVDIPLGEIQQVVIRESEGEG